MSSRRQSAWNNIYNHPAGKPLLAKLEELFASSRGELPIHWWATEAPGGAGVAPAPTHNPGSGLRPLRAEAEFSYPFLVLPPTPRTGSRTLQEQLLTELKSPSDPSSKEPRRKERDRPTRDQVPALLLGNSVFRKFLPLAEAQVSHLEGEGLTTPTSQDGGEDDKDNVWRTRSIRPGA